MPFRIQAVTGGVAGLNYMFMSSLSNEQKEDTTHWPLGYSYELRGPKTTRYDEYTWTRGRWPSRTGFVSDPAAACSLMLERELGNMSVGAYEPWNYGNGGCQSTKFILGRCLNSVGGPVGGAVVLAFRTSDGLFAGQGVSDGGGYYEVPCANTPTDAHRLVAFVDSSPDLGGTTVNTLVPTNRDGT